MGMGFQEKDAKRALRLNNQDIASSVDFLIEERAKKAQKREQDLQRQSEILYVLTTVIILVMIFNFVVTL
jgi:translation elongation factor EF-Ts